MCVLIIVESRTPRLKDLQLMEKENPHGAGIAWQDKGEIAFVRDLTAKEIFKLVQDLPRPYIIHFRWATKGEKTPMQMHPFPLGWAAINGPVSGRAPAVMAHNGTWKEYKEWIPTGVDADKVSDTQIAAFMAGFYEEILDEVTFANALVKVGKKGADITYRGKTWQRYQGNLFSNMNWKTRSRFDTPTYGVYSGSGVYGGTTGGYQDRFGAANWVKDKDGKYEYRPSAPMPPALTDGKSDGMRHHYHKGKSAMCFCSTPDKSKVYHMHIGNRLCDCPYKNGIVKYVHPNELLVGDAIIGWKDPGKEWVESAQGHYFVTRILDKDIVVGEGGNRAKYPQGAVLCTEPDGERNAYMFDSKDNVLLEIRRAFDFKNFKTPANGVPAIPKVTNTPRVTELNGDTPAQGVVQLNLTDILEPLNGEGILDDENATEAQIEAALAQLIDDVDDNGTTYGGVSLSKGGIYLDPERAEVERALGGSEYDAEIDESIANAWNARDMGGEG